VATQSGLRCAVFIDFGVLLHCIGKNSELEKCWQMVKGNYGKEKKLIGART
jgi:hypothetical protein